LAVACFSAMPAAAQGLLDNGLPKEEPTEVSYHLGPFAISPKFALTELGVDTNVFDESVNPKRDYVIGLAPSLRAFGRFGLTQVVVDSSTDITWYSKYKSERALGRALKGRADLLVSRIRASLGGGIVQTRQRPGLEIERRARRSEKEVWTGVGFEVSPLMTVYSSVHRSELEFQDNELFRGTDLAAALNRRTDSVEAGLSMRATPFTTLVVSGRNTADRFVTETRRNSDSQSARAELTFSRDAMIQGRAALGYRQFRPVDPSISRFRGLVSSAGLSFTGFWGGHMDFDASRDVNYSYDVSDGFYLGTTAITSYTQRLLGAFDVSGRYGIGLMDYGNRVGFESRRDKTATYAGGLGFNRTNGGRFGVTYEYEVRDSATLADRRYITRRVYGSYTHTVIR
jgi:hypothetical protein